VQLAGGLRAADEDAERFRARGGALERRRGVEERRRGEEVAAHLGAELLASRPVAEPPPRQQQEPSEGAQQLERDEERGSGGAPVFDADLVQERTKVFNPPVRFLGFFLLTFAALWVLRQVPGLGRLFDVPLLGFYLAAVIVSVVLARVGTRAVDRRRLGGEVRRLGAVDTPHNRGKLGSLHLAAGRARKAVPHLEVAVLGEPDEVEWRFRLGQAYLASGRPQEAAEALARAVELDEEHAYGGVLLSLARARQVAGDPRGALEALERFERNNGPSAESAYRRGQALRWAGEKERARGALGEVGALAAQAPRYQRAEARGWALRALWSRLF